VNLALASTSPRRRALLEEAGIAFTAVDPGLSDAREEELARGWRALGHGPGEVARRLAIAKALAAESRVPRGTTRVLAADTVVTLGEESLGKPRDLEHARSMIERLAGKTHEVLTGVAILDLRTGALTAEVEVSRVRFRPVDAPALERFLASGTWAGKAGAYGVQDAEAAPLVEKVEGSHSNVVGLPLERVKKLLEVRGATTLAVLFLMALLSGCPEAKNQSDSLNPPPPAQKNDGSTQKDTKPPSDPSNGDTMGDTAAPGSSTPPRPFVPHPSEGLPQSGLPTRVVTIGGRKVTVELATTEAERQLGLMHRDELADDHGMLFVYPAEKKDYHSFWMRNTRIPLTAAFIRDDETVVNLEDMEPQTDDSHPSHEPVRLVLEMNKGWFKIHGLGPGTRIEGAAGALPLGE
jgi:MAF protein